MNVECSRLSLWSSSSLVSGHAKVARPWREGERKSVNILGFLGKMGSCCFIQCCNSFFICASCEYCLLFAGTYFKWFAWSLATQNINSESEIWNPAAGCGYNMLATQCGPWHWDWYIGAGSPHNSPAEVASPVSISGHNHLRCALQQLQWSNYTTQHSFQRCQRRFAKFQCPVSAPCPY